MIAGPRGTKGCKPRQVRKEAAAAISTFAMGHPAISVFNLFSGLISRNLLLGSSIALQEYRMNYLVLARKCRPQVFADVVGQNHVVKTLSNAIRLNRIAHAYIFSGPRGVGKTSVARIMAKAINCEGGPRETPCNKCANCGEITEGISLDVREIDGASNRGIDEIRVLRENVKFSPASSKYKIYIIDEVHMLTKEAFNALLKTLEEPPSHVIFMFATTEIFKVPATILSRCQHFDFRRISVGQIADSLKEIARKEGVTISDAGLSWIAQGGEGSLRDAQSIFDQVISYTGSEIKDSDIEELLGIRERKLIYDVSRAVIERKADACLKIVEDAYYSGVDIKQFYQMLLNHMMNLLAVKITGSDKIREDLSEDEVRELKKQADEASRETIQRLLDILMAEEDDLRRSMDARLNLEYVLVRMAYLEPMIPVDEIIARMEGLERRLASEGGKRPEGVAEDMQPEPVYHSADERVFADNGGEPGTDLWRDFKKLVKEKSYPLWSMLGDGAFDEYEDRHLKIRFPEDYVFLENIREKSKIDQLTQIASEFFREDVSVEIKTLANHKNSRSDSGKTIDDIKSEALKDPLVQKVMDIFEDPEVVDVIVKNQD